MAENKQMELSFIMTWVKRISGSKYEQVSNNITGYLFRLSWWLLVPPIIIGILDWLKLMLPPIPYFSLLQAISGVCINISLFFIATIIFGAVIKSAEFCAIFNEIIGDKISKIDHRNHFTEVLDGPFLKRHTESLQATLHKTLTDPEILCKIPEPLEVWKHVTKEELKKRYGSVTDLMPG